MKACPSCSYNIVYENPVVKLYFDKSLLLKYIDSTEFKNQKKTKKLIDFIRTNLDTLYFYNPYWAMDLNPAKYGVTDETDNGFGFENSPADIIEKNQDLKNSVIFEKIIKEYLVEGEFKIFEKEQKKFIFPDDIYLIWWHYHSEDKYTSLDAEGISYELPNGTEIFDRKMKMSLGDNFDFIKKKK